jgi:hypothetical protein
MVIIDRRSPVLLYWQHCWQQSTNFVIRAHEKAPPVRQGQSGMGRNGHREERVPTGTLPRASSLVYGRRCLRGGHIHRRLPAAIRAEVTALFKATVTICVA